MSKPKPIPKDLICSECGLDWDEDNPHASKSDCIEALQEKLENSGCNRSCHCHCYGHYCYHYWWGSNTPSRYNDWQWSINDSSFTISNDSVTYTSFN